MIHPTGSEAPFVSVIIPTYNSAATILRALDSVAAQTYSNFEVIVIDDAGSDDTVSLVKEYGKFTIQLIEQPENGGPAIARNAGIERAKGKYIAFLDSDDEWLPEKLTLQVVAMEAEPEATICGARSQLVDEAGDVVSVFPKDDPMMGSIGWKGLMLSSWLQTSCVLMKASVAKALRFDTRLKVAEDRKLFIQAAKCGNLVFVPSVVNRYFNTADSFMSANLARMSTDLVPMIEGLVSDFSRDLTGREMRRILGGVYLVAGRGLAKVAATRSIGRSYLIKAIWRGVGALDALKHFLSSIIRTA